MAEIKKYLDTTALGTLVDQIKSEDAKVLASAKTYADNAIKACDVAGAAATAEQNAKAYTDLLANGQVATNKADIAKLNGDASTEGSVAKAVADSAATLQAGIDAIDDKVDQNAADIDVLEGKVQGLIEGTYDDTEIRGLISDNAEAIEALEGLHAEDKTILEGAIDLKADKTALDAVSAVANAAVKQSDYNTKVAALEAEDSRIAGLVAAETERATGVEGGLETRLKAVEDDHLTSEDLATLEASIKSNSDAIELLTNGVDSETVDGVNDLIQYVKDHGTEVTGMQEDIGENAEAIAGIEERVVVLEGEMDDVQGAVATKAEKEYVDGQIATLVSVDEALADRISAVEGQLGEGEGSVSDMIADAKSETIAAAASDAASKDAEILAQAKKYADDEDAKIESRVDALEGASATHALKSEVEAVAGDVATLKTDMAQAKTDIDAVEALAAANKLAHEANAAAIALKASQTDLEAAVARIAQNETDIEALEGAVADKADSSDLEDAVARIAANETAIAANTSAINSFSPITSDEVNALFA